jgi:Bifunctional DNA primase/polymerase, N-terminal/Primase C terminal 1 (PriCT-1)
MTLAPHLEALEPVLERGWRIFPIRPRAKEPLVTDWPRRASCDADIICRWAKNHAGCNWGLACGPESGVFVIDVDGQRGENSLRSLVEQHGAWEKTLSASTARGTHFYFCWPDDETIIRNSASKIGAGLDVRGRRGYTIIPPSIHPDGPRYEWTSPLNGHATAHAPGWLLEVITSTTARPVLDPREFGILPEGKRNDGLMRQAGAMRRKGANLAEIETALLERNVRTCRPPLLDYEVRKIAASVAHYPVGGPDPLKVAWEQSEGEYGSNYERFLALARALQQARPNLSVALPLQRIAELMGVHWNSVSRYRSAAVNAGALEPSGQYIPHRIAGLYRVSLGGAVTKPVTKMLTSGLVTIPSDSPSYQTEGNPLVTTQQEPLVTAQGSENSPLVTAPSVWKTPAFSVLSEAELAGKLARSVATARQWNEIAGRA